MPRSPVRRRSRRTAGDGAFERLREVFLQVLDVLDLVANVFQHVALTLDDSRVATLYHNARVVGRLQVTNLPSYDTWRFTIGADPSHNLQSSVSPVTLDDLVTATGLPLPDVQTALVMLNLLGFTEEVGGRWVRR